MLSFENNAGRTGHAGYYISKVKTKDYNVMIDRHNFFVQPVKNEKNNTREHPVIY